MDSLGASSLTAGCLGCSRPVQQDPAVDRRHRLRRCMQAEPPHRRRRRACADDRRPHLRDACPGRRMPRRLDPCLARRRHAPRLGAHFQATNWDKDVGLPCCAHLRSGPGLASSSTRAADHPGRARNRERQPWPALRADGGGFESPRPLHLSLLVCPYYERRRSRGGQLRRANGELLPSWCGRGHLRGRFLGAFRLASGSRGHRRVRGCS